MSEPGLMDYDAALAYVRNPGHSEQFVENFRKALITLNTGNTDIRSVVAAAVYIAACDQVLAERGES